MKPTRLFALLVAPAVAVGAISAQSRHADDHESPIVQVTHDLTLAGAEQIIQGATALARQRGAGGAIAVVDAGGHLIALHRLDGTFPAASSVAIDKARTAATFRKPTAAFENSIKEGRVALVGVSQVTPLQGGVPIVHDGYVVGAVGVSGAHSAAEDEELAKAGAAMISNQAQ
jgi:glc operon protein GlcG